MFALILNDTVVDVADKPFDVSKSYYWVETNEPVKRDCIYDGKIFTAPEITGPKPDEPDNVHCLIDAIAKFCLGIIDKAALQKVYDEIKVI